MRPITTLLVVLALPVLGCLVDQNASFVDSGLNGGHDAGGCASPTGVVSASTQTIDFGTVVVKTSTSQIILVNNCTEEDVTITPALEGPQANAFAIGRTKLFVLSAGTSTSFTVTYQPTVPSKLDVATVHIDFSSGGSALISLQGEALQSGLKITPNPLSCPFVQPGHTATVPVHLTNVGNVGVVVSSAAIVNPGSPAAFAIASGSWTGGNLSPGDSKDVDVTFTPPAIGLYTGELDLSSTDSANVEPVMLRCFCGGAAISCSPLALDFGEVATNIGSTLAVTCTNTGTDVPLHPEAGLILTTLATGEGGYSAQVDPLSLNPASVAQPLAAGESVQLAVSYLPVAATTDAGSAGTLTVNSNATDGTSIAPPTVALSGEAITEGLCFYSIDPSSVQFGEVQPGTVLNGGFTLTNLGPYECLVTGLHLSANTPSAITLTNGPVISQRLSAPGPDASYPTALQVNVQFAPTQSTTQPGGVQFTISDVDAPHVTVPVE